MPRARRMSHDEEKEYWMNKEAEYREYEAEAKASRKWAAEMKKQKLALAAAAAEAAKAAAAADAAEGWITVVKKKRR